MATFLYAFNNMITILNLYYSENRQIRSTVTHQTSDMYAKPILIRAQVLRTSL